jgi:hypothetical protein
MLDGMKNSGRRAMDPLGKLCFEGQDVASYLFQVPDDEAQWERVRGIVDSIMTETANSNRRELPAIASDLKAALSQPPSMLVAEQLMTGFDRMTKLWKSARSGLMDARSLRKLGEEREQ